MTLNDDLLEKLVEAVQAIFAQQEAHENQRQQHLELKIEMAKFRGQAEAVREFQAYMQAYLGTLKILFDYAKGTGDKNDP